MSIHTPPLAPIGVLAFLSTAFLVILSLFIAFVGILRKSRSLALGGIAAAAVVALGYSSVLFGLSALSCDVELPPGAWKYFCEIDCHIANSVVHVQVLSPPPQELPPESARSKIVVVQLKTWFDPSTIAAQRGNGPLMPGERKVRLIDSQGRQFAESPKTAMLLARSGLRSTPLHTPLRPGESYDSYLVFETYPESHDCHLLATSAEDLDSAIWGHEISPFHGKSYFEIRGTTSAGTRSPENL
jgi:hypothetical protein